MSTSYVHEYAKIGSVDDVYNIYDIALNNNAEPEKVAGAKRLLRLQNALEKAEAVGGDDFPNKLYSATARAGDKYDRRVFRGAAPGIEKAKQGVKYMIRSGASPASNVRETAIASIKKDKPMLSRVLRRFV